MNDIEAWLLLKVREVEPEAELEDLYTAQMMFGGRWVMDLLKEYAEQQVKLLATTDVSKSVEPVGRELLLAYNDFLNNQEGDADQPTTFNIDLFLSQQ